MSEESIKFKVSGKLVRLLGRESVSSDIAAIFELIKNAYDADAENIQIIFENILNDSGKNAKITIKDDGHGMDADSINNKWMLIGTDDKEETSLSRTKKRIFIGNKGIGRFATERLCKKITMISKPDTTNKILSLTIDWMDYEKTNITFDDVSIPLQINDRKNNDNVGFELILEKLREHWSREKIIELQLAISSMMLPKELLNKNDVFNIHIIAKEFTDLEYVEIQSSLFKYAPYKLIATIDDEHTTKTNFILKKTGNAPKTISYDFIDDEVKNKELWKNFGKCVLKIYIFPGTSKYEKWNEYYKIRNIGHVRELLKKICGVKIYRDGFWIRPYGDVTNDWLNLEQKRVQSNVKIGNSQIIGFIQISKKNNPDIQDTTTRERLVENNAFHSMHKFVTRAIESMNKYRSEENKNFKENEIKKEHENIILSDIEKIHANIDESKMDLNTKKNTTSLLEEISHTFKQFKDMSKEDILKLESTERLNRNLSSLGISTTVVSHELDPILGSLDATRTHIINNVQKNNNMWRLIEDSVNSLNYNIETIDHYIKFILHFARRISEEDPLKVEKRKIILAKEFDQFLTGFHNLMKKYDIDIILNIDPINLTIYMHGADFLSIILNLYTNSLKSFEKKSTNVEFTKKITISISVDNKNFKMKFSDNGIGVKSTIREYIFDALYTTYSESSGLGLTILRDILDDYGGKIDLASKSEFETGATFIINVPIKNLKNERYSIMD